MRILSPLLDKLLNKVRPNDRYRSIFDNAIEGIFQTTPAGRYIDVNPALAKMYGYESPRELIRHLTQIDHQLYVDPSRRDSFIREMKETGFVLGFESEIHRKDGSTIWISENARAVLDDAGQIDYYEGMVEDITERKRLQENMGRVNRQMQALLESAGEGIFGVDTEGRCTFINRAGARILGYSPTQVFNQKIHDLIHHHPPDGGGNSAADCPMVRAFEKNEPCRVNNEVFWREDGTSIPVEYTSYPLIENGVTTGAVITFVDITERKQAQEQIAEQAALLDKAQDAILVRQLAGPILFWNKGAESIYGWGRDEIVGRNVEHLLYPNQKQFEAINRHVLQHGEWSGEIQHLTKSRGEVSVHSRLTLVRDDQGAPKSILAINTNITEKKKIEAQFMRAQRMESIGTLAGGIAHDLNNILLPIMLSIDVLKATTTHPKALSVIETIEVSSKRGADIVRQVLSFARGVEGERVEVLPRHLLKDVQCILRDTFPKNIRLEITLPAESWSLLGDTTQLHQVLLNLCVNARDAMPNGGYLRLSAENAILDEQYAAMHLQARPGRYVNFRIADSGTGIPQEIQDKIFEPFFTTKEVGSGTGLGLSTVLAIVKSHGGFINVYSEPGKGTTFNVYLAATDIVYENRKQQSGSLNALRGHGETILVVDDEESILNITSETLQTFGFRVLTATDGAEALAVYLQNKEDIAIVLTDMSMPIMDGAALIRALNLVNPTVKIIAASGLNANAAMTKAAETGIKHFLTKPYTSVTLLKTLSSLLPPKPDATDGGLFI